MKKDIIKHIHAREILDSRGNPTVRCEVQLVDGSIGVASVPSGASTGIHEAHELRDGDLKRYNGKGVLKAVKNVNTKIFPALKGMPAYKQRGIDGEMIRLDGTANKSKLGANAILSVSLAVANAASISKKKQLFEYISHLHGIKPVKYKMPVPSFNIVNGGKHADNSVDFQEFMIFPSGIRKFKDRVRAGAEVFHTLKDILKKKGLSTGVGDEGGFAPDLKSNKEALDLIVMAIKKAGWRVGKDIFIAMDPATSEFYKNKKYILSGEKGKPRLSRGDMIAYWADLITKYPIVSIEDILDQDDWEGWSEATKLLGKKLQIVGDDFLVTNTERIDRAIKLKAANAVLIKVNQIGTLTESLDAISLAQKNGWNVMVSHRSGETTDTFIADLVVGTQSHQIKSGSLSRGERLCKYNRLLEIDEYLAKK